MTTRTRGGNGRFRRTASTARRDADAAALHGKGRSFQQIADELGFASKGHAHDAVFRALRDIPGPHGEDAKSLDLERIDRLIEQAWAVMERRHVTVSQGRIVGRFAGFAKHPDTGETFLNSDGEPIPLYEELDDDAPVLAAIDRTEKLIARRAKIIGYEAPARARVEVITEDAVDAEIARLAAELEGQDAAAADTGTA